MQAADELLAWLSAPENGNNNDVDGTGKALLAVAVHACADDPVALGRLIARVDDIGRCCALPKWTVVVHELQRMQADGLLTGHVAVEAQLLKLERQQPAAGVEVVRIAPEDKRLSAPMLHTANSLETDRPPNWLTRSARSLRRVLTIDDPDWQLPLLERTTTMSQRSGVILTSSLTQSFRDRMSTMLQGSYEETFFCLICFENVSVQRAFPLSVCGHQYCRGCLSRYLEVKIRDGEVYPTCFHDVDDFVGGRRIACASPIIPPDIEAVVTPETWSKYERFKFHKEFEHARECPYCAHSQNCRGPEYPECVCEKCKRVYCFIHSNAHQDSSCADFERRQLESEKLNRAAIATFAKPCPGCQTNVEKNGGCNHMTCIACQTSFCWICGHVVDNVTLPDHYAWWNISGCAGRQLVDVDNQTRVERFGWMLFRALFFAVCVPIATAITVILTVLSGCCIPCVCWIHEDPKETFLGTVNTIASFVQLLVAVVVVAPISVVAVSLRCVGSCFCTCCFWPSQPRMSQHEPGVVILEDEFAIAQVDAQNL